MAASTPFSDKFFVAGHLAKGVVYTLIGGLALATVFTAGGQVSGARDVLDWIQNQTFGNILIVIVALGMLCYCAWRWIKAVEDTHHEGDDAKGLTKRVAYATSGSIYGLLAVTFLIGVFSSGNSNSGGGKQGMLADVLGNSWGVAAVITLAAIMLVVAIVQLVKGWKEKYMEDVDTSGMDSSERTWFNRFGKIGFIARGVVYLVIAYFLVRVALSDNASQFKGVAGALEYIQENGGTWLFVIISLGLLLYGVFMFVKAKYRPRHKTD